MAAKEGRIVVDTNVLISALINPNSIVWDIIRIEEVDFFAPEITIDEIENYEDMIKNKLESKERKEEYSYLTSELFHPVIIVPTPVYEEEIEKAYKIMKSVDEKDTEFLALALSYGCPIWSDDSDFKKQSEVKTYTSKQIVDKLLKS